MEIVVILIGAYIMDRLMGDPRWLPHPVIGIGKGITILEKYLIQVIRKFQWNNDRNPIFIRLLGLLFPIVIVGGVFCVVCYLMKVVYQWNEWAGIIVEIILVSTTIATKGLVDAGKQIYYALQAKDLEQARTALSMVVGRDTAELNQSEIVRGGVETLAENIVDAITSPLFYAAIGGAPLAMAYRAINTLDSMVGYKNEKYLYLGWASARLDDLANWLPARLTVLPMFVALGLCQQDARQGWKTYLRDAHRHPSPNSGIPEAMMAGGLHIELGGTNYYQGKVSERARMGTPLEERSPQHLAVAMRVVIWTSMIYICLLCLGVISISEVLTSLIL